MRKFGQKLDTFHIIFIVFAVFFSFILFLSIPSLFDYKKLQSKIAKEIESDFNLIINNISEINYRFVPSPHLIISKGSVQLNNETTSISNFKDLKIYISLPKLYNGKLIKIKKIVFNEDNFKINLENLKLISQHLDEKNINKLKIKKSKLFFYNNINEVTTISPIRNLNYFTDNRTKKKKLKIIGNLFDTNYNFYWEKDLGGKKLSNFSLKFRNPTINFENTLILNSKDKKKGLLKINIVNQKLLLDYEHNKENIIFKSLDKSNDILSTKGNIELNPFYFDIQAVLKKQNITKLIHFLSSTFLEIKTNVHPNLSGKINIQLEKMRNAYFNSGYLNFQIADSGIKLKNNLINIRNIGNLIIKDTLIYKDNENIIFASKLEINVQNQDQFYKRLSISKKNRVKIDKIFVILEKNLDKDIYTLSEIYINKDPNLKFTKDFLITIDKNRFDNFQKFRSSIQSEFEKFN